MKSESHRNLTGNFKNISFSFQCGYPDHVQSTGVCLKTSEPLLENRERLLENEEGYLKTAGYVRHRAEV